jgi:AraC family transcriptional regulator
MSLYPVTVRQYFGARLCWQMEHAGILASEVQYGVAHNCSQHTHERAFFSLLLDGHYSESYRRGTLDYRPLDVGFHPEGTEHADRADRDNSRFLLIELAKPWVERLREYAADANLEPRICNAQASWLAARLYSEKTKGALSPLALEGVSLELLATIAPTKSCERKAPRWITAVLDMLQAEHASRHSLESVARRLGLHPVYLARTFRKFQGESPARYLMRVRIRAAMNKLANSEVPVSEVALLTGFFDQSHLTRALKQHTGMTPAVFRSAAIARHPRSNLNQQRKSLCLTRHGAWFLK